ncbi:DNA cytosine methyltransferase [Micromonospora chersina]|uniref:DNA cytosine methyltransferase n=1 Tax=Micromonospora chersina TaxID=47854 RepID=UPI00371BEB46
MITRLASVPALPGASRPRAAEFFAGIGLVRLGLESSGFKVVWSNDVERDKRDMYLGHFGESNDHTFALGDVGKVVGNDMPAGLDLAWASFPCTDLSLAGWRRGLSGSESSTFWDFTRILDEMGDRRPPVVALENVVGFATSHGGEDLATAIRELNRLGYSVDVLTLDARRFVPQSRARLFMVGAMEAPDDEPVPNSELRPDWLQAPFGDPTLRTHRAALPAPPAPLTSGLSSEVEIMPDNDERWWSEARSAAFLDSLSEIQAQRLNALRMDSTVTYRTAYRRTRKGVAVWEIRPDDISGCLRTARGGSSKQAVVQVGRGDVRVRWMTPLEYARLMGAGDYKLDGLRRNQALFGFGDAVCVPAVSWLGEHYLLPLVEGKMQRRLTPVAV